MFWFSKKKRLKKIQTRDEYTWRLENEIYRQIHELEALFVKLDETKQKGKNEKNANLRQLKVNEYLFLENKIRSMTISLKEMQKTYIENQEFLNKEQLLNTYKMIDDYSIADITDLKKIVLKIKDIQETRMDEEKARTSINEDYNETMNTYAPTLENERAKQLAEQWATENEDEETSDANSQGENRKVEESKGDL